MSRHTGSVLACLQHSEYAVTAGYDQTIKLWKVSSGQLLQTIQAHNHIVSALALAPSATGHSNFIISSSWDKSVKVWNFSSGKLIHNLQGHNNRVRCLSPCKDGLLASGSDDGQILLWNYLNGRVIMQVAQLKGFVLSLASLSSPSSSWLHLVAVNSGTKAGIHVWTIDPASPGVTLAATASIEASCVVCTNLTNAQVASLSKLFSPSSNARWFAEASGDATSGTAFALFGTNAGAIVLMSLCSDILLECAMFAEDEVVSLSLAGDRGVIALSKKGLLGSVRWDSIDGATRSQVDLRTETACQYSLAASQRGRSLKERPRRFSLNTLETSSSSSSGKAPKPELSRSWTSLGGLTIDESTNFHCCSASVQDNWILALVGGDEGLLLCHPLGASSSDASAGVGVESEPSARQRFVEASPRSLPNDKKSLPPIRAPPGWNSSPSVGETESSKSFWSTLDTEQLSLKRSRLQAQAQSNVRGRGDRRGNHRSPAPQS